MEMMKMMWSLPNIWSRLENNNDFLYLIFFVRPKNQLHKSNFIIILETVDFSNILKWNACVSFYELKPKKYTNEIS